MKFVLFPRTPTRHMLDTFPELAHFDLFDDRWELRRARFRAMFAPFVLNCAATMLPILPLGIFLLTTRTTAGFALFYAFVKAYSVDPTLFFICLVGLTYGGAILLGISLNVPMISWGKRRLARQFQDAARRRGVFYCSRYKCRYDCTGIKGNVCPECGAVVPGLVAE